MNEAREEGRRRGFEEGLKEGAMLARMFDKRRQSDDDNLEAEDVKLELDSMLLNEGDIATSLLLERSASLGS